MIIEINYFNVVITNHSISNIFYNIYNFSKYKIISTWHMPFSAIFKFQFSKVAHFWNSKQILCISGCKGVINSDPLYLPIYIRVSSQFPDFTVLAVTLYLLPFALYLVSVVVARPSSVSLTNLQNLPFFFSNHLSFKTRVSSTREVFN